MVDQPGQPPLCGPFRGRANQRLGHGQIVDCVKEIELGLTHPVGLVEEAMLHHRDAAHVLAVLHRQKEGGVRVLVEGEVVSVKIAAGVRVQQGNPMGIPPVEAVGQADEALDKASVVGWDGAGRKTRGGSPGINR